MTSFAFTEQAARRIVSTVRRVERSAIGGVIPQVPLSGTDGTLPARLTGSRLWDTEEEEVVEEVNENTVRQYSWVALQQDPVSRQWIDNPDLASSTQVIDGEPDDFAQPAYHLTAADVRLGTRVIIQTGGGYDSPEPFVWFSVDSATHVYLGRITAVNGTENATYDAELIDNPSFGVEDKVPLRGWATDLIDMLPAAVDDLCIIFEYFDEEGESQSDLMVPTERPKMTLCAGGRP